MDGSMEDELRALVSDFRQYALAEISRGVRVEPLSPVLSATVEPDAGSTAESGQWFEIAAKSRDPRGASLESTQELLTDGRVLHSWSGGRHIVYGIGSDVADLMILGESRDLQRNTQLQPFTGQAGEMLEKMLNHVLGLTGPEVYLLNIVKSKSNQNKDLRSDDVIECRAFLKHQVEVIQPKIVLVLGTQALKAIFGPKANALNTRGRWAEWQGVPVMPTFHPNYLLRNSGDKRLTFQDLKAVRARYDAEGGRRR